MDKLSRDAAAATAAGMTYGKWKAAHPETQKQVPQEGNDALHRICARCGKGFTLVKNTTRKYCSNECAHAATKQRANEKYRKHKQSSIWV